MANNTEKKWAELRDNQVWRVCFPILGVIGVVIWIVMGVLPSSGFTEGDCLVYDHRTLERGDLSNAQVHVYVVKQGRWVGEWV
jgi:hypothetical protein